MSEDRIKIARYGLDVGQRWRKVSLKALPAYLLGGLLLYTAQPQPDLYAIGLPMIFLGMLLRLWAAGHLRKNGEVTTTGPYAYVKNPLYLGTLLNLIGFCLIATQWAVLAAGTVLFFLYYAPFKKKRESDRLRNIFGEVWDAYDRAVPDYLPRLSPYGKRGAHRWEWSRVVANSEAETALATLVGITLVTGRFFV